jgi:hypothetical protein
MKYLGHRRRLIASSNTTSELNYRWGGTQTSISSGCILDRESQTQQPAKTSKLICLCAKCEYFTKCGSIFKLHNYSQALAWRGFVLFGFTECSVDIIREILRAGEVFD